MKKLASVIVFTSLLAMLISCTKPTEPDSGADNIDNSVSPADEVITYVNYGALFGERDDYVPVCYRGSGFTLEGEHTASSLPSEMENVNSPDELLTDGTIASSGEWEKYPDCTWTVYDNDNQPENPVWNEYITALVPECSDVYIRESCTLTIDSREIEAVTAGNAAPNQISAVSADSSDNRPETIYAVTAVFIDGKPYGLFSMSDKIDGEILSFEPAEGFLQEYEVCRTDGEPLPLYSSMNGDYIVRDYRYLPKTVFCDVDGDTKPELILCVKKASSVMSYCEIYELTGDAPEKKLHIIMN